MSFSAEVPNQILAQKSYSTIYQFDQLQPTKTRGDARRYEQEIVHGIRDQLAEQ